MGEIGRKLLHLFFGIIAIIAIKYEYVNVWHFVVLLLIGIILSLISKTYKIPLIHNCLTFFGRKNEKPPGKGALALIIGIILALLLGRETNVSLAAIAILTVGDSVACLIGTKLWKTNYLNKTINPLHSSKLIEGTIIGMILAGLSASIFVSISEAFFAAFCAMTIEGIEIKLKTHPIDDNMLIPVVAIVAIYIVRLLIGGV